MNDGSLSLMACIVEGRLKLLRDDILVKFTESEVVTFKKLVGKKRRGEELTSHERMIFNKLRSKLS